MKKLTFGSRDRIDYKEANIKGFNFNFYLVGSTNNTAIVEEYIDLDAVQVSINLNQRGKETSIYSGPLGLIAEESSFYESRYNYIKPSSRSALVLLAHDTTVKPILLMPVKIELESIINLDGDDKLSLTVNINSSVNTTASSKVSDADSYVTIEAIEGIGLQYLIPKVQVYTVQGSEANLKLNLGDNIQSICFINRDKTSVLTADDVISSVRLSSDRLNFNKSHIDLLSERCSQFSTTAEADARCNNFMIVEKEVDKCIIDFTLTSANVTAAKNFVVVRSYETSSGIVAKAEAKARKHQRHAFSKVY